MILRNLSIYGSEGKKTIHIENGKIKSIANSDKDFPIPQHETIIDFDEAIAFPGFINSHDHLDFNFFPQLRSGIYKNYRDWGYDIHRRYKRIIDEVLKIPESLRIRWGLYKNLLNGFTTVVNHGKRIPVPANLVNILQTVSLHSPAFEKNWRLKLNSPLFKSPIVIHVGEGTDTTSKREIDEVIRWNLRKKKIVAVHGVAMNEEQAASFYGLVWCPASNYFLLDQTANIEELKNRTNIVFGTDSTLTASWNLWEHFRKARESGINEVDLLSMLISKPAKLWGLGDRGEIAEGKNADVIVVRKKESFFDLNPEDILMVIRNGEAKLFDESISIEKTNFDSIDSKGKTKFVSKGLRELTNKIRSYLPGLMLPFKS